MVVNKRSKDYKNRYELFIICYYTLLLQMSDGAELNIEPLTQAYITISPMLGI